MISYLVSNSLIPVSGLGRVVDENIYVEITLCRYQHKCMTDTDENGMTSSQHTNVVSGIHRMFRILYMIVLKMSFSDTED